MQKKIAAVFTGKGMLCVLFAGACVGISGLFLWAMGDSNPLTGVFHEVFGEEQGQESSLSSQPEESLESEPEEMILGPIKKESFCWDEWQWMLVDEKHPLDMPMEQILLEYQEILVDSRAFYPLEKLMQEASEAGYDLRCTAGYRSREEQEKQFQEEVEAWEGKGWSGQKAREKAKETVEPGGCSEHQTGLAVDICPAQESQAAEASSWLQQHAWEYGFILRYPQGKEEITGVPFSSVHYRYVGAELAEFLFQEEICLEEYVREKEEAEESGKSEGNG